MKAGWEVKTLGEVCGFQGGTQPPKSEFVDRPRDGYVRLLQIRDFKSDEKAVFVRDNGKIKKCVETDIMIGRYGASVGQIHRGKAGAYNVALIKTLPDIRSLDQDYFYYYLTSDLFQKPLAEKKSRGAQDGFNQEDISPFPVPLPPLDEQKRIVAVLDEAFEGLSRARANAEANLADARELFKSTLAEKLTALSDGWKNCSVAASFVKTKVPAKIQRKEYLDVGRYPVISQEADFINGYWDNDADVVRVSRPVVVFGDHTRNIKFVDFDFVVGADGTQIMEPISEIDPEFYHFVLRSIPLEGKGYARHFSHLKKEEVKFPTDLRSQRQIAEQLAEVEGQVQRLENSYRSEIETLDALRHSLLQKAFCGDLTR